MKRSYLAAILSVFVPGLGHIWSGRTNTGACILAASILIGTLNILVLPLIAIANPVIPPPQPERAVWAYWIPRIAHDVLAVWSIVFWTWAVVDAAKIHAQKN